MMELLHDNSEQLCSTKFIWCWMVLKLAFLHQFSVLVVCHRDFDKGSRSTSVSPFRPDRTFSSRRRIGSIHASKSILFEYFDESGSASAGLTVRDLLSGSRYRGWCSRQLCDAIERSWATMFGEESEIHLSGSYIDIDWVVYFSCK